MGKTTGFMEFNREVPLSIPPVERLKNYQELYLPFPAEKLNKQAARCMDCGVPFCHYSCPLGNIIPEFNDMVYRENWEGAYKILSSTNNFPEFTGRICPAPCENSCVAGYNRDAVTIELIEKHIIEKAFELGIVKPQPPAFRTGKRVAVVGSGPAGLAAAAQLNKAGHWVVVFERADRIGGLLRYGIPDFKLDKKVLDRRIKIMREEGIAFKPNSEIGGNVSIEFLMSDFDAIVMACGSTVPRSLNTPGFESKGVHVAMDFLSQQNKRVAGDSLNGQNEILATGKNVVVIGGGDTGSDCVGTSNRHGAASVTQIEILPQPPVSRADNNPWPQYAKVLKTTSSHEEGCERMWSTLIKEYVADSNGVLKGLKIAEIIWEKNSEGRDVFREIPETEREIPCELALLAVGFAHTEHKQAFKDLGLEFDQFGNIKCNNYRTNVDKIFAAGDMRRGQSLVVWALSEGREAAKVVDQSLMGKSMLESKESSLIRN
jgi:glutamate synthase (NADPH) small chain